MEGAARYHWFAERYHWTPDEVDNAPAWLQDRMPAVAAIQDDLERERMEAARRG